MSSVAEDALRAWWTRRAADFHARWFGPGQGELFRTVHGELDLLDTLVDVTRSTPDRSARREVALAVARLWPLWTARDLYGPARLLLQAVLDDLDVSPAVDTSSEILWTRAWLAITTVHLDEAAEAAERLRALAEASRSERDEAAYRQVDGIVRLYRGNLGESRRQLQRAAELHGRVGDSAALVLDLTFLSSAELLDGDPEAMASHIERATRLCEECGDEWLQNYVRWVSAVAIWDGGDRDRASELARAGVSAAAATADRYAAATYFEVIADFEAQRGHVEHAAALLGASARLWRESESSRDLWNSEASRRRATALLSARMTPGAFRGAYDRGAHQASDVADWSTLADSGPPVAQSLTPRQREVAVLLAEGATNRAIADALGLTERTVEMHVGNIFARLRVRSRAQVATWIAGKGGAARGR